MRGQDMPYEITWTPRHVYAKFSGKCSVKDILVVSEKVAGDPRLDELQSAIFDYLEVEYQNATEGEVEEIAALQAAINHSKPNILFASVATDERIGELWRHFALFHVEITDIEDQNAIFTNIDDAKAWIAKRIPAMRLKLRPT